MRLAVAAALMVLTVTACGPRAPEIVYGGDEEATKMFEFCAGSSPYTVEVRYGGPPRLIDRSGSVITPTDTESRCLAGVAERFPARSPQELARAEMFRQCLTQHDVEMPLQAITVDLAADPQQLFFSDVVIPDALLDAVDAAVTACRTAE